MKWPTPQPALKTALAILRDAFGNVPVSAKMPKQRPLRFVRVDVIGGTRVDVVTTRARVLIELFGPDPEACESMFSTASAAMLNAQSTVVLGAFVRSWDDEQGPVARAHPDVIDMDRWQFHGDFTLSTTTAAATYGS
jgi:hypothetical protein